MSGHNKWSQIKRQKGATDDKRAKLFGQLGQQIALEAKAARGDRNAPGLKRATLRARTANLPKDNIERAIERGFANQ